MSRWNKLKKVLQNGELDQVHALIDGGVDLQYTEKKGYDALIYASCGVNAQSGANLLEILRLLIDHKVPLSGVSDYGESAVRILSRIGRFDGVRILLEAGSDEAQLAWTPLIRTVATGTKDEVLSILNTNPELEETDFWSRTAWHVAILRGNIEIVAILREAGSNTDACGHCLKPSLFYAIEGKHPEVLKWLISIGQSIDQRDEFGTTAVIEAVECGSIDCLQILIDARADVNIDSNGTALYRATSKGMVSALLNAGADPSEISHDGIRSLFNLGEVDSDVSNKILNQIDASEHAPYRTRTFGRSNPEKMTNPFWLAMINSGASGYEAGAKIRSFGGPAGPNWSAQRFGQSFTVLEDGRVILVAGEHEDGYDPDFCIYNDVFVLNVDGTVEIYGYPDTVFPPTDFHTATLVDGFVYIIGCLGYPASRKYGFTPVFKLSTSDYHIERVTTSGEAPGWIYKHRAALKGNGKIIVDGGLIVSKNGNDESHVENRDAYEFDIAVCLWRKL